MPGLLIIIRYVYKYLVIILLHIRQDNIYCYYLHLIQLVSCCHASVSLPCQEGRRCGRLIVVYLHLLNAHSHLRDIDRMHL